MTLFPGAGRSLDSASWFFNASLFRHARIHLASASLSARPSFLLVLARLVTEFFLKRVLSPTPFFITPVLEYRVTRDPKRRRDAFVRFLVKLTRQRGVVFAVCRKRVLIKTRWRSYQSETRGSSLDSSSYWISILISRFLSFFRSTEV